MTRLGLVQVGVRLGQVYPRNDIARPGLTQKRYGQAG